MNIQMPKSGLKLEYWNGQEDKSAPLNRLAGKIVQNNVSARQGVRLLDSC